ncbi:dynein heavy chain domain-containing protein 1 isoform X2 [Betta splendens]|nr:dynein heavy chain domain-containing protein 1 isoform X2 [Betta splendens]
MCDTSGFFLEICTNVLRSDFAYNLTPDLCEQPVNTEERHNSDRMTGRTKVCCWQLLKDLSDHWLLLPKQAGLMVHGNMVHGCYYPLSKTQLEWQISISDNKEHIKKKLTRSMQEAEQQHQQLLGNHSWLVDIYLFISQWTHDVLDSMKGKAASLYEEHIQKLRHWTERINMIPPSLSTSNLLLVIHCTNIKETLVKQLRAIEKEVLQQLDEQIRLHSDSLISDLEMVSAELKMEPQHLSEFTKYALMVRESGKKLSDMQKRLKYIHSLQNTVCANYRKMTKQEITLDKKMLGLWNCLIPLLKQADSAVCSRLPSVANALDTMSSFVVCDLENLVSKATSGAFVDPSQNAKEMVTKLNYMCAEVHHLNVKLEQLAKNSQNLQEHTLDLTILTTDLQKVKARKELWELKAAYTTWMEEWELMLFNEVVVSQAQGKVSAWKEQAACLKSAISTDDPVLHDTLTTLENLSLQLAVMAKLKAPTLRHKHWEAIFNGIGLLYVPEKVTVVELMHKQLQLHQKLITRICLNAQAECNMEETFQKLCQRWKEKLFWLDKFTQSELQHGLTGAEGIVSNLQAPNQHFGSEGRFIIIGLEMYCAEIESDRMTLSTMLKSPYSIEFRPQIEDWMQSLQELEQMLRLFKRYQQMWAFLMKMFNETFCNVPKGSLLEQFQPVDKIFKEVMCSVMTDPHVLNFVTSMNKNDNFQIQICQVLINGLLKMEAISNQVMNFVDSLCEQFPRLWFLSDREIIELLSLHPTPLMLEPFVCKCFKGIRGLEVDRKSNCNTNDVKGCVAARYRQMKVLGTFSSFQEHIAFLSPVEPNLNTVVWLGAIEKQLKLTVVQLMKQCAVARKLLEPSCQDLISDQKVGDVPGHIDNQSKDTQTVLDLVLEYPLQCLLVAEEAVWCSAILNAFQELTPIRLSSIKAYNSAKLKNLVHCIRTGATENRSQSVPSKYAMMCVRALVQVTMNHAHQLTQLTEIEGALESSFEWISMMKYHIVPKSHCLKSSNDETCYVDVLGHRFQYGFEYFGPDDWIVNNPSTDRAVFGILFALTSYRCGFVRGPCMSGKNKTVVQLGKALGRMVVTTQCFPTMTPGIVQKRLLGALYTGALLLLDSVNLLTQEVLSLLAQYLVEIHQSFSDRTNSIQRLNDETKSGPGDLECRMTFAGKTFSANVNYGCVLISSSRYTSEVPPSLQFATRPIALTYPDYRVIAEVMLTSVGFLEALSLSQRLVSLISLAKDSFCLPDVLSNEQCSYLVVLQKIISASEIYLQQCVGKGGLSVEIEELSVEPNDSTASHNVPAGTAEKSRKERLRKSCLSVKQGLLEETAIVKSIMTVLVPVLNENEKASRFDIIFKDVFPMAIQFPFFQHYIEEHERNQLKSVVAEFLQAKQFQPDTGIVSSTIALYQTLKRSQTVLLLGPPGGGKTTCYCALAGALNSLAANVGGSDDIVKQDAPQMEAHVFATNWNFVDTMVIFPNGMSHTEVFGDKSGWQDGVLTSVLTETEQREKISELCNNGKKIVKWLIMDGEPVGQPGWLDCVTTLCCTGETSEPSKLHPKLLMEVTDLSGASPSAVTHCSIVHVRATDLWKAAWKSEVDALCCEHRLDQRVLKIWNSLAEDLFSSTFTFLRQKSFNSAICVEGESQMCGLQEVMSFVRILRALLYHYGKEKGKTKPNTDTCMHGADTTDIDSQSKQQQFAIDLFLVAYTWGFGGHLHPRHWPQFDLLVRQVLFNCRYRIIVPGEESVFEHVLKIKTWPKNTLLTTYVSPKYGKYTDLLNLMLKASQPVLLAGEPGSGKTTLCQTLLSFDMPHISLQASPLLSSKDLRNILINISSHKYHEGNMDGATKQPRLLLFVDDLHEAPCDVFGKTSMALELLRESMSKGEILSADTYCFKFLTSGILDYMATCCYSGLGSHQMNALSSRLSRLFSIFVLPCLSVDVILSIHSPKLQVWLKEMPLKQSADEMACCVIAATQTVYRAVLEHFPPTRQRPQFLFSQRDLHKVFSGMYLWRPNIPTTEITQKNKHELSEYEASVFNIVQLWMHECMRTFSDRLCSEDETRTLVSIIAKAATAHFGIRSVEDRPLVTSLVTPTSSTETAGQTDESQDLQSQPQDAKASGQSKQQKDCSMIEPSLQSEKHLSGEENLKTLQHMEDLMTQLVFGPDLLEPLNLVDCQPNVKCSSSYNKLDLNVLMHKLSAFMDQKEADGNDHDSMCNIRSRYIVSRQRVRQLLHILRALLMPGGHGVLIGLDRGTGRKTTVRLAACLAGYQLMEVHSGNEDKLHDILKDAGNQTRVSGCNVIILVHEGISQRAREELLVAMAQRSYPALHTEEEVKKLIHKMTAVNKSRRFLMDSWIFEKYLSQVHRNVHVFLLLSITMSESEKPSIDGPSVWNKQMTKALSLSCCVEVYQSWSNQCLMEAATQCLPTILYKMNQEGLEPSLSVAMAGIHQSACHYASVLLDAQPFSPQTYMDFIAYFGYLCNHLHKQWQNSTNRIDSVVAHLDAMNTTAEKYKQQLKRLREKVAETQQCEQSLLRAVDDQKPLTGEAERMCLVEKQNLHRIEKQIHQAQIEERPIFQTGLKILQCLNPSDLEEVRHYRDPPDGVVRIMDAICLLFNHPPGWESAKQLLGRSNFFQELEFFDRNNLTNEQLQQLGQIVHSPQFAPESVREVSKACESLCRWVQALYEWCLMKPQLSGKRQLEALAREVRAKLLQARQHKEDALHRLQELKLQLQLIQNDLEQQLIELSKYEHMEKEATAVVGQVKTHIIHWKAASKKSELQTQNRPGDAIILAAVIAYLGPFAPDIRAELLSKWRELCHRGYIDINPEDPRASLFASTASSFPPAGLPISLSETWQQPLGQALGWNDWQLQDTGPARLLVRLLLWGYTSAWNQHWPLLADIQIHNEICHQSWKTTGGNKQLETEFGLVLSAADDKLLDKLYQAAETGLMVLVTHVESAKPSPQFLARLVRSGKNHHVQPPHPGFRLFLCTHLPVRLLNNEIHPSILSQVNVVDLSLSSEEIQDLILTKVLQSDCKKLLIQHLSLQKEKNRLQEKLFKEQDALVDFILKCNTSLQDSGFVPCVAARQEAVKKLQSEIQQLTDELDYHESLVTTPRELARLAAALNQSLQDMSILSPAYYFSLHGFIRSMQEAVIVKDRPLVIYTFGNVLGDIVPEITNRMVAQLLTQYKPCLFKSHFAVLKLLVSLALLQYNGLCSEGERVAFLRGLEDIDHTVINVKSTGSLPSWIPAHIHPELLCLEKIPSFRGLIASLSTSPIQWKEYLHLPSSTVIGRVPCRSHAHLSLLQRALLWKTVVPHALQAVAEAITACNLSLWAQTAGTEVPHASDPEALSKYIVKHKGPIILTLPSPRGGGWTTIQPFDLINKMAFHVEQAKKIQVKVVFLGALCEREAIFSALDKAVTNGHWLVFNDCHLLEQWKSEVMVHLSELIHSVNDEPHLVHPCFQLWFMTQEHSSHLIPAALRMRALPLVCDSPFDLKEELRCSLRQVASVTPCQSLLNVTADDTESLLCCAIFHSVLLQRQNYKYLRQGRIYNWSQEDLQVLINAHNCIARICPNRTKVLQYIAVNLVHGSHVLDSADLEEVESVAKVFLSRFPPLWASGAKVSSVISSCNHLDLSEIMQILSSHLDSPSHSDQLMLGFSAEVAAEIIKISSHSLNVLLRASQTPLGIVRHVSTQLNRPSELPTLSQARERLQELKSHLTAANLGSRVKVAGAVCHSPLRDFLQEEWDELIDLVSSIASQLQQPVQFRLLTVAFLLELSALSQLERRAELLSAYLWHHDISDPPAAYRLSAFRNSRGFLVAVIREAAHVNHKYISDVSLHFQIVSDSTHSASAPLDAVYLCGLELRGATWDSQHRAIQDSTLLQPCLMPLVCLKAQVRSTDTFACKTSYSMSPRNVHVSDASASVGPRLPVYHCPLYVDAEAGDGGQSHSKIITVIPLQTRLNPLLCSLRGMRLVSTL